MKTKEDFLEGQVILIDKPLNWSSFQAVNAVKWAIRRAFGLKKIKVGHAGTLDPLATGLLLICTGKFTKRISELQAQPKEYTGIITFGATRPSYDMETEIDHTFETAHITQELLGQTSTQFLGKIEQQPPIFSAVKKNGKRLYEYARAKEEITLPTRTVEVFAFEITEIRMPEVEFRVCCSKGTYIRSLAHDLGKALNSGAYLSALRRTKIGDYNVNNGLTPENFKKSMAVRSPKP